MVYFIVSLILLISFICYSVISNEMASFGFLALLALIGSFLIAGRRLLRFSADKECACYLDAAIVVLVGGLYLLKRYFAGGHYSGNKTIKGKTVIITGSNTGIGLETARELARRGGRIIMACRDAVKSEVARKAIVDETGNNNVIFKKLDLASFASIKAFCKDINESESHIDILINNAGVMVCPKMLTEDGIEMQIGVNHIGHFLLTHLLLDKIKASAPSRIIILSSYAHTYGRINFDDLNSVKKYSRLNAYNQSKLANVLHARELAKRLKGTGVTVNSLHPGVVNTEIFRYIPLVNTFVGRLFIFIFMYIFQKTAVEGAQTTLRLALDPSLDTITGHYFSDCEIVSPAPHAQVDETAKQLWAVSEAWIQGNIN